MNMDSAPKDGTRILIKHYVYGWSQEERTYINQGTSITECSWHEGRLGQPGRWVAWRGSRNTISSEFIEPIAWMPVPSDLL